MRKTNIRVNADAFTARVTFVAEDAAPVEVAHARPRRAVAGAVATARVGNALIAQLALPPAYLSCIKPLICLYYSLVKLNVYIQVLACDLVLPHAV